MSEFFEPSDNRENDIDVPNFFTGAGDEENSVSSGEVPILFDDSEVAGFQNTAGPENTGNRQIDLFTFSTDNAVKKVKKKSKKKKIRRRILMSLLSLFLVGVITATVVFGAFLLWAYNQNQTLDIENYDLNSINGADGFNALFTSVVYVKNSSGKYVEYKRLQGDTHCIWVEYDRDAAEKKDKAYKGIPQNMVNAVVAIEDKRFYKHQGTDWKRTFSAFANMFLHFYDSNQGGSTITQQLVKNLTNDDQQNAKRKVREILSARYLEENYAKDTIVESYLNLISLGHNIKGVQVAANYYFGKTVDKLTLPECATLAGITKNPSLYSPDINPDESLKRRNTVLSEMLSQGYITKDEYNAAVDEKLEVVADEKTISKEADVNSYFIDALIEDVQQQFMKEYGLTAEEASYKLLNGGYRIYATMDSGIQSTMEKVYSNSSYALKHGEQTMQSSMTVMDYKGNVLGIVGGLGEKTANRVLNRATSSARQPGSSIKPLSVYAPCIEGNYITYSSLVEDRSKSYGGWKANNYGNTGGRGAKITVEYALEQSYNTIPVKLLDEKLGLQASYDFLTNTLGLKHLNPGGNGDLNLSPLGMGGTSGGLTTLESAAAYAIFGNHGTYHEPHFYTKITDSQGNPLRNPAGDIILNRERDYGRFAISEDTADVMNHLLQNIVKNGTAKLITSYLPKMPVYGKTGTTNDEADLWFCGGTPYYVGSCWCGYDKVDSNGNRIHIRDTNIAKKIWGSVMQEIHRGKSVEKFTDSPDVKEAYFCTSTGQLAGSSCGSKKIGWYRASNVPPKCSKAEAPTTDAEGEKGENKPDKPNADSSTTSSSEQGSESSTSSDAPSTSSEASTSQETPQ